MTDICRISTFPTLVTKPSGPSDSLLHTGLLEDLDRSSSQALVRGIEGIGNVTSIRLIANDSRKLEDNVICHGCDDSMPTPAQILLSLHPGAHNNLRFKSNFIQLKLASLESKFEFDNFTPLVFYSIRFPTRPGSVTSHKEVSSKRNRGWISGGKQRWRAR